jgi:hypothetical protein
MANFWRPRDSCKKSELEIFSQRPVQTDIEGWNFTKIYPLNNVKNSTGPIEFFIQGSSEDYIDLDNTLLCMKVKVTKSDGKALANADKVFPVNNWMHSLFSDVTCILNETSIEGGTHMYPYKAYLTNLLLYGENAKKCQLQTSGYAKDQAGKFNAEDNNGAATRKAWIQGSRVHDLVGPLHLDICQQGKLILSQVDIRFKLQRSKAPFNLISLPNGETPAIECSVEIEEAFLKVRRVQVAPDTIRQHETGLQLQNALYPIQRTEMHTYTVASGTQSHVKENLFHGKLPKLIVLGIVNNDDFNGKLDTNPFCFRHKNLVHVGMYKDGVPIPHAPFTPDFSNNQYAEEYMALMDSLDVSTADADLGITKTDYGNGYTLFAFNLSADKVVAGHAQPIRDGNLRIELKFKETLDKAINIVTMAIYDDEIQISRLRKVAMDYSV